MRPDLRVLAALVLVAACGTTVPSAQLPAPSGGDGLDGPSASAPGTTDGQSALGGADPTTGTTELGSPSHGTSSAGGSGSSVSAPASQAGIGTEAVGAPGGLRIGTYYFDASSTNSLIASVGVDSEVGDMRAEQRAVAAWINSHGGAGGHQLSLVQHKIDVQGNPDSEAQALCSAWTEDAKVHAGIGSLPTTNPVLVSCMAKHKTLAIGGSSSNVETSQDFQRWAPYYYAPAAMELVSAGRIYGQGLLDKKFLTRQSKVGILYVEDNAHEAAYNKGLLPALAKAGITPTVTGGISYDGSYAQYGSLVSQAQSQALRFRSQGVTHVLFVDTGGALAFWFMQQAQSQGWTPRYGLSTLSAPSFLETNVDVRQLAGAAIVGWRPADDLTAEDRFPPNPARQLCSSIMKRAGLTPKSAFDLQIQLTTCSGFFLLKTVLDLSRSLDPATFRATVAALGVTNTPSASGFVDHYASDKPWGGFGYATGDFVSACGCFRYDGRKRTL